MITPEFGVQPLVNDIIARCLRDTANRSQDTSELDEQCELHAQTKACEARSAQCKRCFDDKCASQV